MTLSDTFGVMNAGRIEQIGTPADVYRRPAARFAAACTAPRPMNIMEGTAEGAGLVLVPGSLLPVTDMAPGLKPDSRVHVGIRPEDVRVSAGGETAFRIDVDFIEELGATQLFHGKTAGDEFVLQAATGLIPADVKQLALVVDPANVHLFDRENGQRLGRR